ncbi:MAG: PucR family transcriptional regulator [Actinomycetota bacterium]
MPVIHDPSEELVEEADGILLLVGAVPTAPATVDGLRSAARNGYAAVVAKLHGQDPQPLIYASLETGIASLASADELPWRRLDALLSAAIGVGVGTSASLQTGDMFSLANAVAGVLGGAVAIEDAAQNVVAYSTLPDQRIDQVRSQGILARRIPDLPKHDLQYREVFTALGIVHYPFDAVTDELPRAAIPIRAGGEVLGSIWVIEEHPPLVADENKVLVDAAKMAALYFLRIRTAGDLERQTRGEMLRSLLEGRVAAASTAESLGLRPAEHFVVVGFSCTNINEPEPVPFIARLGTEVSRYFLAFRPDVSSVAIGRTVYALMPSLDDERLAVRFAGDVARHAESVLGRPVRAAVQVATSPLMARHLRDEIDEVLQVLTADGDAPHVATAQQVHNRILIARLNDALERYPDVLHPSVEAVQAHDRERGTMYGQTLLAYFRAMGDAGAAARHLRIHPNTLRYRLRRAQLVFGLDLDDPDERLLVWMQLRLLGGPAAQDRPEPAGATSSEP